MKRYTSKIKRKRGYTRTNKKKNNFKGSRKKHRRKGTTRKNKKLIFNMRGGVQKININGTDVEILTPAEYNEMHGEEQIYFENLIKLLEINKIKAPTIEEYNRNDRAWRIQKYGQMYQEALTKMLITDGSTSSFNYSPKSPIFPSNRRSRHKGPPTVSRPTELESQDYVVDIPTVSSIQVYPESFEVHPDSETDYDLKNADIQSIVQDPNYEVSIGNNQEDNSPIIRIIDHSTDVHTDLHIGQYGIAGDVVILENIADIIHDIVNEGFLTYDAFLSVKLIVKSFSPLYGFTEDESWEICCRPLHIEIYDKIRQLMITLKNKKKKEWNQNSTGVINTEIKRINSVYKINFSLDANDTFDSFQLGLDVDDEHYKQQSNMELKTKGFNTIFGIPTWEEYFKFYLELCQSGNSKTIGGNLEEIYKHDIYDNYCKNKFCFNFKNTSNGLEAEVALKYSRINEKTSITAYGVGGKEDGIAIWKKVLGSGNNFLYDKDPLPSSVFENFLIRQPTQQDKTFYPQEITVEDLIQYLKDPDNNTFEKYGTDYKEYIRYYLVYFLFCVWKTSATPIQKRELLHLFRERFIYNQSYQTVKTSAIHTYKQKQLYDTVLHLNFTDAGDKMASATPELYQQLLFQRELGMSMDGIFEQSAVPNACDEATSRLGPITDVMEEKKTRSPVCNFDPTFTYEQALKTDFCVYYKRKNEDNTYLKVKQKLATADDTKNMLGISKMETLRNIYTGILNDIRYLYGNIINGKKMNTKRKIEMKFNYFCLYLLFRRDDGDFKKDLTDLDNELKDPNFFHSDFCKSIQDGMKAGFLNDFFSTTKSSTIVQDQWKDFNTPNESATLGEKSALVETSPFYRTGINTSHAIIDYAEKEFTTMENKELYNANNLIGVSSSRRRTTVVEKLKSRPSNESVFHEFLLIPDKFKNLEEKIILSKYWFDRTYRVCGENVLTFNDVELVDPLYTLWKGKCISITKGKITEIFNRGVGVDSYDEYLKQKYNDYKTQYPDAFDEFVSEEETVRKMHDLGKHKISVLKKPNDKYEIFLTYETSLTKPNEIDKVRFFSKVYGNEDSLTEQLNLFQYLDTPLKYTEKEFEITTPEYKMFVRDIQIDGVDPRQVEAFKSRLSTLLNMGTVEKGSMLEQVANLSQVQWYNTLQPLFNRSSIKLLYNFLLFDFEPFASLKKSRTTGGGMSVQETGINTFIQTSLNTAIDSYDEVKTGVQEISVVQIADDKTETPKYNPFIQGKPSVTRTLSENRQYVVYMLLKHNKLSKSLAKEIIKHFSKAWWNSKKRTEEEHADVQTVINKLYRTVKNGINSLSQQPSLAAKDKKSIEELIDEKIKVYCDKITPDDENFWAHFGIILNHKTQSDEMQLHFQKALKALFFQDSKGRGIQPIYQCYTFDAMCAIKGCRKGSSVLFQKGRGIAVSFFERPQNTVNQPPHWLHKKLLDANNNDDIVAEDNSYIMNLNVLTPSITKSTTCNEVISGSELREWYEDNIEPIYQDFNRNIAQDDAFTAIDIKQNNYREIYNDSNQIIFYLLSEVHRDNAHNHGDVGSQTYKDYKDYKQNCKNFISEIMQYAYSDTPFLINPDPSAYTKDNRKNRLSSRQGKDFMSGIKDYTPFNNGSIPNESFKTETFVNIFNQFAEIVVPNLKETTEFNTLFKNQLISFIDAIDNLYHNIINAQYCETGNVASCSIETAFFLGNYQNLYLIRILYGILCCLIINLELDDEVGTLAFNKNAYELILNSSLNAPSPWVPEQTFTCKNGKTIKFDEMKNEIFRTTNPKQFLNPHSIVKLYSRIFLIGGPNNKYKGIILLMRTILRHIQIWNSKDCSIKMFLDEYFNERMKSINKTAEISRGVSSQSSAIDEFSRNGLELTKQIKYADKIYIDLKQDKTSVQAIDMMVGIGKDLEKIQKTNVLLKKSMFEDIPEDAYRVVYRSKKNNKLQIKSFKDKETLQDLNIHFRIRALLKQEFDFITTLTEESEDVEDNRQNFWNFKYRMGMSYSSGLFLLGSNPNLSLAEQSEFKEKYKKSFKNMFIGLYGKGSPDGWTKAIGTVDNFYKTLTLPLTVNNGLYGTSSSLITIEREQINIRQILNLWYLKKDDSQEKLKERSENEDYENQRETLIKQTNQFITEKNTILLKNGKETTVLEKEIGLSEKIKEKEQQAKTIKEQIDALDKKQDVLLIGRANKQHNIADKIFENMISHPHSDPSIDFWELPSEPLTATVVQDP